MPSDRIPPRRGRRTPRAVVEPSSTPGTPRPATQAPRPAWRRRVVREDGDGGGSRVGGILGLVVVVIVLNVLSSAFHWGLWFY